MNTFISMKTARIAREAILLLAGALIIGFPVSAKNQTLPQLGKSSLQEVVKAMTTEEKAKLLVGMGIDISIPGSAAMDPEDKKIPEKVPGAAGRTHAILRLGIPSLTLSDGPAGVRINPIRNGDSSRTYYATAFPIATSLASSWDTSLVRKVGVALGSELRDYGIDILLAPAMNIHRNPLGGRNFEYYSEDPVVTGNTAAAFVKGVQSNGVGTSLKHFAANNQECNRMQSNTVVSERALREIYLKGFESAVKKSQPWTVMSSYNLINGRFASESPELPATILRKKWGFKGFVMTDWFAGSSAVAQMQAGNDVIMPGNPDQTKAIITAVNDGSLSLQQLDENVENDFMLSVTEQALIKNIAEAFHAQGKKVIVVMNVGGVTEVASWRDQVDAILLAWQPGQEGGNAIADVLSGKINPSGKLATTFPVSYNDVPSAKNFPGKELVGQKSLVANPFAGKPSEVIYEEGIYVGYRYYNSFSVKPAYEFGYGLSYTDFAYSNFKLSPKQFTGKITATVIVTNNGKVAGKDIVQLYISAPAQKMNKPESELKAFAKTALLQPGQSQTLAFTMTAADLASYDSATSSWIAEAGTYTVKLGASSLKIKQTATMQLAKDLVVEKVNKVLTPQVEIDELINEGK